MNHIDSLTTCNRYLNHNFKLYLEICLFTLNTTTIPKCFEEYLISFSNLHRFNFKKTDDSIAQYEVVCDISEISDECVNILTGNSLQHQPSASNRLFSAFSVLGSVGGK